MSVRELHADLALGVQALLGEGPVWDDRESSLLFVDIEGERVHRFDPSSGRESSFATGAPIGSVALRRDGGLVLALLDHFALCGSSGEELAAIPGFSADASRVRFNDGEVDPWGRFVAGTMDWGKSAPLGELYQLAPDGTVTTLVTGATLSTGLAGAPDRRRLYSVDSPPVGVAVGGLAPADGTLSGRRRHVDIDESEHGRPDGIALDTEGCLWVAFYGGSRVCRFTPTGALDTIVRVPASCVTSVAFAGPRLDTLYITSARTDLDAAARAAEPHAGDLFVVDPGVSGLAAGRFG
jgi:sugar lactone lactonase YvrE